MTDQAPDGPGPDGLEIFQAPPAPPEDSPPGAADPEPAPVALRAFAFLLDGIGTFALVVLGVSASVGVSLSIAFWPIWVVPAAVAVLDTALTAWRGITPGKAVLGLRVVDAASGAPLGVGRASLRGLVILAPAVLGAAVTLVVARLAPESPAPLGLAAGIPVLGWVALLIALATRPRHRGLQDLAGRSVVLRVR